MYSFLHKLIRVILIIFLVFILGWLTYKKLSPSGEFQSAYDMKKESPFISKLYPKNRVSDVVKGEDITYREALTEPIYFNLKPPGEFLKVKINIKYQYGEGNNLKFGGLANRGKWAFKLYDIEKTENNEWGEEDFVFDFNELVKERDYFRFMFSSPELKKGELKIDNIETVFMKEKMTLQDMVNKIIEAIKWRLKKF